MQNTDLIKQLAISYFEGKATPEDEVRVLDFIKQSEHNKVMFRDWEAEWQRLYTPDSNTLEAWESLVCKMRAAKNNPQ